MTTSDTEYVKQSEGAAEQPADGNHQLEPEAIGASSEAETPLPFYVPIQQGLIDVENRLQRELSSNHPMLEEIFSHGRNLSGKRLRPALTLLCSQACGEIGLKHLTCAAVMELIHLASLVHDDILDESDLRRHQKTVNARWNNELAVLFGDLLLARSVNLAASLEDIPCYNIIAQTSAKLCEGELLQIVNRGNYDLSEEMYYNIISGKTASLIECSCRLGAMCSGADEATVQHFAKFGSHLGIAFQIIDDLLDLSGDENSVGKTLGQDIKKQKATLAVIFALQCVSVEKRAGIIQDVQASANPVETLMPWLKRTNALEYAKKAAEKHVALALQELESFTPPESGMAALDSLKRLTQFVLTRDR